MRKLLVLLFVFFNFILTICCLVGLYMVGMILLKIAETQEEETIEDIVNPEQVLKDLETPQPFGKAKPEEEIEKELLI